MIQLNFFASDFAIFPFDFAQGREPVERASSRSLTFYAASACISEYRLSIAKNFPSV
jgi:hypothetical protein